MRIISLGITLLLAGCGTLLSPPLIQGKVVDEGGQGIPGAVVSDGQASTCTDEAGNFKISSAAKTLRVLKPRYQKTNYPVKYQVLTIKKDPNPVKVAWDLRWSENQTTGVQGYLAGQGFTVLPFNNQVPEADIWVLPCPARLPSTAITPALAWVKQGKTLVVFGEWGGYPAFAQASTNTLLEETGISFSGATVRRYDPQDKEKPEWVLVRGFSSRAMLGSITKGLQLFTAGSLEVKEPGRILAQTENDSYRIAAYSQGSQVVAAYAPLGYGKITVWSDTSFLTDTDSLGAGTPDWKNLDNAQILTHTLNW